MKNQKGFTLFELVFVIAFIATILFGGVVLYTAGHFISKFW